MREKRDFIWKDAGRDDSSGAHIFICSWICCCSHWIFSLLVEKSQPGDHSCSWLWWELGFAAGSWGFVGCPQREAGTVFGWLWGDPSGSVTLPGDKWGHLPSPHPRPALYSQIWEGQDGKGTKFGDKDIPVTALVPHLSSSSTSPTSPAFYSQPSPPSSPSPSPPSSSLISRKPLPASQPSGMLIKADEAAFDRSPGLSFHPCSELEPGAAPQLPGESWGIPALGEPRRVGVNPWSSAGAGKVGFGEFGEDAQRWCWKIGKGKIKMIPGRKRGKVGKQRGPRAAPSREKLLRPLGGWVWDG
ncbi:uncharacterized protein LOC117007681 [Catharus ustulatus]|uniref:uncharacterized protein LOC117007681 n=1 Tax=Catharus ustulatus TaxID=91951 RepID=UPI00140818EE|nr:uncharacterized protein LOC117007681 [Catharus ustulatus]